MIIWTLIWTIWVTMHYLSNIYQHSFYFSYINSKQEEKLFKYINDANINIKHFNIFSSDILGLTYERIHTYGPLNFNIHPVIASLITSKARTVLYEMIDKIDNHPATECVYFDTDSIMVLCDPNMELPDFGEGEALGCWVSELASDEVSRNFIFHLTVLQNNATHFFVL